MVKQFTSKQEYDLLYDYADDNEGSLIIQEWIDDPLADQEFFDWWQHVPAIAKDNWPRLSSNVRLAFYIMAAAIADGELP